MATTRNIPSNIVFRVIKHPGGSFVELGRNARPRTHDDVRYVTRSRSLATLSTINSRTLTICARWGNVSSHCLSHLSKPRLTPGQTSRTIWISNAAEIAQRSELEDQNEPEDPETFTFTDPFFPAGIRIRAPRLRKELREEQVKSSHEKQGVTVATVGSVDLFDARNSSTESATEPEDFPPPIPPYIPAINRRDKAVDRDKLANPLLPPLAGKYGRWNRRGYLKNHILAVRASHGPTVALKIVEAVLKEYVSTADGQDWNLARRLYISLCSKFPAADLRPIRNALVRSMLQESPPRLFAVCLLFDTIDSDNEPSDKHVRSYLIAFCDEVHDSVLRLAEVHKILQGAQQTSTVLTARVLLPIVQAAIAVDDPGRAHGLMVQLSQQYNLSTDFGVLHEIVKGYARQQNWSAVDDLLAELHQQGYSRAKRFAFATLVRHVVHFFAAAHPPDRTFDFLTYLMQNHGLVPTASLTIGVLKTFISARRYDLVEKWIHERQSRFPSIMSPLHHSIAAYDISAAWLEAGFSPVDVWLTCKALSRDALRDPFTEEFRSIVNELLLDWLYKHTEWTIRFTEADRQHIGLKRFHDLRSGYECAFKLIDLPRGFQRHPKRFLILDAFTRQVLAVRSTHFLINHFKEHLQSHELFFDDSQALKGTEPSIFGHNFTEPPSKRKLQLPSRKILAKQGDELIQAVTDHFNRESVGREHTRHGRYRMLVDVIRYLKDQLRWLDCGILVKEIWNSGVHRAPFLTYELIDAWIRTAIELQSQDLLHGALWAAIDAGPQYLITDRFMSLVRVAVSETTRNVEGGLRKQRTNEVEELTYLVSRLYRRKWQEAGCLAVEEIANPYLRRWKEEESKK